MQIREQPPVLAELSPDLRSKAEKEAAAIFAARLSMGVVIYPIIAVVVWISTDYGHEHLSEFVALTALTAVGIILRLSVLSAREKICAKSPELWYRLIGLSVVILASTFGLLLAHAIAIYGFEKWTPIIILIWITGVISGSALSFAPNGKLLRLQLCGLLLPPLVCALWLHSSTALQYAFANVIFFLFTLFQGKQMNADFWKQLTARFLEDQRREEIELARRIAEEERDKAKQAAKARSEFLTNMSHEIRTPMNAVMGMTNLILDQDLPNETLDYVKIIRSSSDALLTIINDILDFSKIESGKLEIENEPFCLYDCIEEVLELLANRATQNKVELVAQIDPDVAEWISGDVTRTRQILLNLVGNAVKFTAQGEVVVSAALRRNGAGSQTLYLAVRDTGIGIPAEKIAGLFQSFNQVDNSTVRRFGGTGLGLAISKRLTELMGGRIWVSSEFGVGSVFQIEIPYQPAAGQEATTEAASDWPGKRILVVDDNETNRISLTSYLNRWKFRSRAVSCGEEAMEAMRSEFWDAILLDWQMPGMSGAEFALAVRQEFGSATPPIIVLSSASVSSKEAFGDGPGRVAAVLSKPVRRQQLQRVVGEVLSGSAGAKATQSAKIFDADFSKRIPLRVLLAEDNAVNQKVAIRMLERLGYRPDAVGNGLEVLEALRRQTYDLVLMDVHMPEMNGLDATRSVIDAWGTKRPWITALTAGAMKENREDCIAAGVDDFLTKPINVKELQEALERCFYNLKLQVERPVPLTRQGSISLA